MAAEADIDSGRDVSIYTRRGNYLDKSSDKSKLALYKPLLHCNTSILNSCS